MAEILDGYDMSNKIVRTLDKILKNDVELEDFTIISTGTNTKNKSPVLYETHNLGLESWCIKPVYQYVCSLLLSRRKQLISKKLPYNEMENMNSFLNGALLINPDMSTFWNMKRQLLESDIISIEFELRFSKIVLTYKSKSNEAFAYRRWLIKKILDKMVANNIQVPPNLLQNELAVVNMASEKSQNNYHSWNHRIWCIENLVNQFNVNNIIYSELSYTEHWVNKHISEHSGYHYRQYLIQFLKKHKKIISVFETYYTIVINKLELFVEDKYNNLLSYLLGKQSKKRILEETCSYINYICIMLYDIAELFNELNQHFSGHQSLYYHRRFLIFHLLRVPFEYHGINYPKPIKNVKMVNLWNENVVISEMTLNMPNNVSTKLFKNINTHEYTLTEIVTNYERSFISNQKDYLTKEYYQWLKNVVGFE